MRPLSLIPVVAFAFVLALAGCGRGSDESNHYSISRSKDCLGAERMSRLSTVFFHASEGVISVETPTTEIVLAFGRDHEEAEGVVVGLKGIGLAFGSSAETVAKADELIRVKGNVAYWAVEESGFPEGVEARIEKCLDESES